MYVLGGLYMPITTTFRVTLIFPFRISIATQLNLVESIIILIDLLKFEMEREMNHPMFLVWEYYINDYITRNYTIIYWFIQAMFL